ncbi:MAG: type II toxin-antitoxin system HipA family toxin [Actinobacteria bacterium]|nr:type II toxin-antitoxin system HipA family toxin [Actinomycetota bacterium]
MPASAIRALDVYLSDRHVGKLFRPGSGRLAFQYDDAVAAESAGELVLSASLPVRASRFSNSETRPFFEGLLPEGTVREQIARERGVSVQNTFGLLAEIGAECAGAVVIVPVGEELAAADTSSVRWLSDEELADALANLPAHPLGGGTDVRLSLGGVQQKLIVTRTPWGKIGQPLGGAPSTHIIKPSIAGWTDIATNEAFCLGVARCCGLTTATSQTTEISGTSCLIVERFDRTLTDELRIVRLHQEDFCQALGVLPESKYEFEGGPSVSRIVAALRDLSAVPAVDVNGFLRAVAMNYLVGNSDAHGKNYAVLYDLAGGVRMAPLYDIVCTAVYDVTSKMAMFIGGEEEPAAVTEGSWQRLAEECGVNPRLLLRDLRNLATRVRECAAAVAATATAEGWHRPVIDRIRGVIDERATLLQT